MRSYIMKGSQGKRTLEQVETVQPAQPGRGEVLVKVRAASFNYRDVLIMSGLYGLPLAPDVIPASDGAGDVIAVGEGVTNVKVGDRVASAFFADWHGGEVRADRVQRTLGGSVHGMLTEVAQLPATAVLPFPDYMSYEEAATLPCAAVTAWNALVEIAKIKAGDVVLLQGTGGVSMFSLQFAKMMGATVIHTSSSDDKLEKVRALGADHGINYAKQADWDVVARGITGGRGVDVVIDVGGAGTLERALGSVRLGGLVVTVGLVSGIGQINPLPLIGGVSKLVGVLVGSHDMYFDMCRAMAQAGTRPVISERFAFADVPAAFERFRQGVFGKLVVTM